MAIGILQSYGRTVQICQDTAIKVPTINSSSYHAINSNNVSQL